MSTPREPANDLLQKLERATGRGAASRLPRPLDDPEVASLSEGWRVLDQALRGDSAPAPAAFASRVFQETQRRRTVRRHRQRMIGVAAALVLLIGIGAYVFRSQDPAPVAAPQPRNPAPERRRNPEPTPVPEDKWLPPYLADDSPEPAAGGDPWDGLDQEIAGLVSNVDTVEDRWHAASTCFDYVARRFQEMELEVTVTHLF